MTQHAREIEIDGLQLRLRRSINVGRKGITYFDVKHNRNWLNCGDPWHGETTSKSARQGLAHYARAAIAKAEGKS